MEYDDDLVYKIAEQYALLRHSIEKLKEVRGDKQGAILGYTARHYISAEDALKFLNLPEIPQSVRKRLKIWELEEELLDFANMSVK
ncbi:MAG: hypothetical protein NTW17_00430 [Candidatus Pacearchaeota archaeon]|nr:hypothetical protein [Candidatus Pacearchaeota archaeon]